MAPSALPQFSLQIVDYMLNSCSSRQFFLGCIFATSLMPSQQVVQFSEQSIRAICADNAVPKTLRDLFYLYVLGPFLPAEVLVSSVLYLLPEGRNAEFYAGESPEAWLLRQYLQLTVEKVEWIALDRLKASAMFLSILPFWLSFTEVHLSDRILNAISKECEVLLRLSLMRGFSPILLRMRNSDILLQQCLLTKLSCDDHQADFSSADFMAILIGNDPVRFGSCFLRLHMRQIKSTNYLRIFHLGILDKELCAVFRCQGFDKPPEAVDALGTMLDERSRDICSSYSKSSLGSIDCFLSTLCAFTDDLKILERVPVSSHILLASAILSENDFPLIFSGNWPQVQKTLVLTLQLCRRKTEGIPALARISLLWCAKALPLALKSVDADYPEIQRRLIQCIMEQLRYEKGLAGSETLSQLSSLALSWLRCSMESVGDCQQSNRAKCLKLVQALVHTFHGSKPHVPECTSFESLPLARTIFEQLISHTNFTDVLLGESSDSERRASIETLRLMKTCLMSTSEIMFDERVWSQLLACFDAGVSEKDYLVRWMLKIYAAKAPSVRIFFRTVFTVHRTMCRF